MVGKLKTLTRALKTGRWNSQMQACCRAGGPLHHSLLVYLQMSRAGIPPDHVTFPLLLKASVSLPSLALCSALHTQILKSGFGADTVVATALVGALSKCSDVAGARKVFDEIPEKDLAAWNSMLAGYSRNGFVEQVFSVFGRMQLCGLEPNASTLSILLQGCCLNDSGDWLRAGKCIHGYAFQRQGDGHFDDLFFYNSLVVFYSKCRSIEFAERVFDAMCWKDVVSWNAMLAGYSRNGYGYEAVRLFHRMQEEGVSPDLVTLETALQACAHTGDAIEDGRSIHKYMVENRFSLNVYVENSLLLMYCKCGDMDSANHLFDGMHIRNLVSWNILIDGYVQNGQPGKALYLFKCNWAVENAVSSGLLVTALQALKILGEYPGEQIMCIHCLAIKMGLNSDAFVISSLISAYGECANIVAARGCFDNIADRGDNIDIAIWNAILSAYAHNGWSDEAIYLFRRMELEGCRSDAIGLVNILVVCTQQSDWRLGKVIHGLAIRKQYESNVVVSTALMELYLRCGFLIFACLLFRKMDKRNAASWNTMIFGCCQNGFPRASLNLFHHMMQHDDLAPDATTMVGVIEAISERGFESERKYIHDFVIHFDLDKDEYVANSLIAMYAEFGNFDSANLVFCRSNRRSTVTWNTMISVYSRHLLPNKAIAVFQQMKVESVAPDSIALLSLLPACAYLASLTIGMWIHSVICKAGYESNVYIGTALINVYAKCADINTARQVFERMSFKTIVSWNSIIWGYAWHGDAKEANSLFMEMQRLGLDPDIVTFLALISGCSHSGDVEKGQQYFDLMVDKYSILPRMEHFSSLVDLLSRNGLIKEAFEFIDRMPISPEVSTWGTLLGACRVQQEIAAGLVAAEKLFKLDPVHCGYHILTANMFSESGLWADASMTRKKITERGVMKHPGWSKIDNFI
ncbi:hypothetical protein ACLOJK_003748 [Asimina triloba]